MTNWNQLLREKSLPGAAIWPLRLFLGITFIWASLDKLRDAAFFDPAAAGYVGRQLAGGADTSPLGGLLSGMIVPNATLFGMLTMAGELLIGLAVLLGWYTRFSAILGLFINLMFYLTITWDIRPFYYGADIVFVAAWLTLALTGPGPLSVDAYLARRFQPAAPLPPAPLPTLRPAPRSPGARSAAAPRPPGAPRGGAARPPTVVNGQFIAAPGARAGDMSRRQFNVLGLGALVAAVLGLLEMAAWPLLHQGGSKESVAPAGSRNPTASPGPAAPATPPGTAPAAGQAPPSGQQIAGAGQVPAGQALEFTNPSDGYPGVLVHNDSGYSAYYAVCTHEGCQVSYNVSAHLIACPCHGAEFDPAANGQVVRGPARQPLQPIAITVAGDGSVHLAG